MGRFAGHATPWSPTDMSYEIRDARNDELDFILHSQKMSMRNSSEWREKSNAAAFGHLNPFVNAQVARMAVLVAARGREILGWLSFEVEGDELVLGYVYVKDKFRRQGVARELLLAAIDAARDTAVAVYVTPTTRFAELAERYSLRFRP